MKGTAMTEELTSLLAGLNRDQLQSLVLKLVEQKPSLTESIRVQAALLQTSSSKRPLLVDTKQIHRQVTAVFGRDRCTHPPHF